MIEDQLGIEIYKTHPYASTVNRQVELLHCLTADREDIQHDIVVSIKHRLQLIKDEVININYAIHWAKVGIVNSYIFSNAEMNQIKEIVSI